MILNQQDLPFPVVDVRYPYYAFDVDNINWILFYDLKLPMKPRLLKFLYVMFVDLETLKKTLLKEEVDKVIEYLENRRFLFVHNHNDFNDIKHTINNLLQEKLLHIKHISMISLTPKYYGSITNKLIGDYLLYFAKTFFKIITNHYKSCIVNLKLKFGIGDNVYYLHPNDFTHMHNVSVTRTPEMYKLLTQQRNDSIVTFDWKSFLDSGCHEVD